MNENKPHCHIIYDLRYVKNLRNKISHGSKTYKTLRDKKFKFGKSSNNYVTTIV